MNYNGKSYLEQFLPFIFQIVYKNYDVFVIDNQSTDESILFLKNHYADKVKLIQLNQNYGFAGGYNEGLKSIKGFDYTLLLNSDVEVRADFLQHLVDFLEKNKDFVAVQPKILSFHKKTHFEYAGAAGGFLDVLGYPFCRGRIFDVLEEDKGQYDENIAIFWASGAAICVRNPLFEQFGGFDALYFAHQEEIDLCWRWKRAGYQLACVTDSVVYHVGGGTLDYENPRKTFLNFRNSLFTLYKNMDNSELWWKIPLRLVLDGLAGIKFLLDGKSKNTWAIIKAHFAFYAALGKLSNIKKINTQIINSQSINTPQEDILYKKSILWQFYIKGEKTFAAIQFLFK